MTIKYQTLKYRLRWNLDTLQVRNDYKEDCRNTITLINNQKTGHFESDNLGEIEAKIKELNLKNNTDGINDADNI